MGLADPVYCENDDCSEYGLPKANPGGYPLPGEGFVCGECGHPVTDQAPPDAPEPDPQGAA